MKHVVGWISSLLLLVTFGSQTYRQWKGDEGESEKYTLIFFVAAIAGTAGNFIYSLLVNNWVFTALNAALVVNNAAGLWITVRNRKQARRAEAIGGDLAPRP
ncbi:hypothetical protein BE15_02470 [Sorangium cellulosum]|uniref:Uncharacterized protein n=2 Tax=Sorangium cellulosum TaxID=56 RepID=A0A150Q4W9_SORCE|nr:hypothetical protein BE15_02470 [Sorangium cellulosum]